MREIQTEQLQKLGFRTVEPLTWGEGTVGINSVVSFSHEPEKPPLQQLPARFLSGFIPPFLLAEEIHEQTGIMPPVRIFFPKNLAHAINGIDIPKIEEHILLSKTILTMLQRKCFPNVNISFVEDEAFTDPSRAVLEDFSHIITSLGNTAILETIRESARRHGGEQGQTNTNLYIAHHPFGWQEIQHEKVFKEEVPDIVLNALPVSERRFTELRRSVRMQVRASQRWVVPNEVHDIEMNTAGAHYLLLDPGEPSLQDALSLPARVILERFQELRRKTKNDNIRKAKNDFEKMIFTIAERIGCVRDDALDKSLAELLGVFV